MAKRDYKTAQMQARREWLERKTTEELQAALDPLVKSGIYVNDGGKTLIRQILAERGISS